MKVLLVHGRLERLGTAGPYAVIGHSLGGVLLRSALSQLAGPQPMHFIMLGTPNQPPRLARVLGVRWVYRRIMGQCGVNLSSPLFYASLPLPRGSLHNRGRNGWAEGTVESVRGRAQ